MSWQTRHTTQKNQAQLKEEFDDMQQCMQMSSKQVMIKQQQGSKVLQAEYGQRIVDPFNAILSTCKQVFLRDIDRGVLLDEDREAITIQWSVMRFQIAEYRNAVQAGKLSYQDFVECTNQFQPKYAAQLQSYGTTDWVAALWKDPNVGILTLLKAEDIDKLLQKDREKFFNDMLVHQSHRDRDQVQQAPVPKQWRK